MWSSQQLQKGVVTILPIYDANYNEEILNNLPKDLWLVSDWSCTRQSDSEPWLFTTKCTLSQSQPEEVYMQSHGKPVQTL